MVPPLGSLWIIPYKAKSEISDILSSLPNNLVIIIVLFSSLIMCGMGAGVGVQYASHRNTTSHQR